MHTEGCLNYNGGMNNAEFNSYLKSEYDHISEAHFRTIDTITAFFRHYILIMSIPISLIAAFVAITQSNNTPLEIIGEYTPVLIAIFLVISLAGFGVLLYLVNLRMDAILYARTVNSIRKHFYDNVPNYLMSLDSKIRTRVLPQTRSQPSYKEWRYFGPVVSVIAILNAFYLCGAIALIVVSIADSPNLQIALWWALPISLAYFGFHFLAYSRYATYRDHSYLKSYIIGVDICGVLNEHRPRFCEVLQKTVRETVNPEDITVVPVHEHPTLNITRQDERKVFNEPEYWTEMRPTYSSVDRLRSIRNAFKLKVMLFTHRPWPNPVDLKSAKEIQALNDTWKTAASDYYKLGIERGKIAEIKFYKRPIFWLRMKIAVTPIAGINFIKHPLYWSRTKIGITHIEQITRHWLEWHEFEYDKLVVEKGSDDIEDPQAHFRNRFHISRQKKIRFFVEDILEKAEKLAYICDVVFLFDHPYNRNPEGKELPSNIVRVKSWEEIYKEIRRLS